MHTRKDVSCNAPYSFPHPQSDGCPMGITITLHLVQAPVTSCLSRKELRSRLTLTRLEELSVQNYKSEEGLPLQRTLWDDLWNK